MTKLSGAHESGFVEPRHEREYIEDPSAWSERRTPFVVEYVAMAAIRSILIALMFFAVPEAMKAAESTEVYDLYSEAELIDGFVRTVFGSEGEILTSEGARHVKKFTEPVRVYIDNTASIDRTADVRRLVSALDRSVRNLSISVVSDRFSANLIVYLVNRSTYRRTIRATLPEGYDSDFIQSMRCSGVVNYTKLYRIQYVQVYVVATETRRDFLHCISEELTQGLGPVNDDWRLKYSLYNDFAGVDSFGMFDWFLLNMLYDRRIKPGMTVAEAKEHLPAAIRDASSA